MASPESIKLKAKKMNLSYDDLKSEKNKFKNQIIDNLDSWWKGEPGEAFKNGYINRENEITKVLTTLNNISSTLYDLADAVKKVDDEKLAEAKRNALKTKKK